MSFANLAKTIETALEKLGTILHNQVLELTS